MFPDDEIENIIAGVRNEVKGAGMLDTRENCWKFFIDRVRRQLKLVLCFSPVGSTLRIRSRKFPAIINCTQVNWFHEWPQEALVSVAKNFLQVVEVLPVSCLYLILDSSRYFSYLTYPSLFFVKSKNLKYSFRAFLHIREFFRKTSCHRIFYRI